MNNIRISVITATYNAIAGIKSLCNSLQNQTNRDFEWIIADGGSTDGTLSYLESLDFHNAPRIVIISARDFGIYDALNHCLEKCSGEYYLVVGADDTLNFDAIENYGKAANGSVYDIISANIKANGELRPPLGGPFWLRGVSGLVSRHSVGTLIKRSLHSKYGMYSNKYHIASDEYFLQKVFVNGGIFQQEIFIAGNFGTNGLSCKDSLGTLVESFRVRMEMGSKKIQIALFLLRFFRNIPKFLKTVY